MSEEPEDIEEIDILALAIKYFREGLEAAFKEGRIADYVSQFVVFIVGYQAFASRGGGTNVLQNLIGGGTGLLALRLATSSSEAASGAGIAYLGYLGLASIPGLNTPVLFTSDEIKKEVDEQGKCPDGYQKVYDIFAGRWVCMPTLTHP